MMTIRSVINLIVIVIIVIVSVNVKFIITAR